MHLHQITGDGSQLRVAFVDFWPGFKYDEHILFHALSELRTVAVVDPGEADLLIYSAFGWQHRAFTGPKVHHTEENRRPPWREADFCIGFDHVDDPCYLRLPSFIANAFEDQLVGFTPPPGPEWADRDFCNFIYSWAGPPMRRTLFECLSDYRKVTSPGQFLTNASAPELSARFDGDWRRSKILYQRRFRFTIACENGSFPGYVTEKLYDPILAGSIPIYWGSPSVSDDLDERAFVDCHAFRNLGEVVDRVAEIDADPKLAASYLEVASPLRTSVEAYFGRLVQLFDQVAAFVESATDRKDRTRLSAAQLRAPDFANAPSATRGGGSASAKARLGAMRRRFWGARRLP